MVERFFQKCFREMNQNLQDCIPLWEVHRLELKKMFSSASVFSAEKNNVLVIGAGNCYDIPLNQIIEEYNRITLLDIDETTLCEVNDKLDPNSQVKVNLMHSDFANLPLQQMQQVINYISKDLNQAYALMESLLLNLEDLCKTKNIESYSLILSSTVSSQLVLPFVQALEQTKNSNLIDYAKQFGDRITELHIKKIWDMVDKNDGAAIITSEQYAWGFYSNGCILPLNRFISDPILMLNYEYQKEFESVGGGLLINGRISNELIRKHIPSRNIILERQWIWQFSNNIHYLIKGWLIVK
ncbi:hypothetical protein [Paenibacillus sp. PAMC 26794]|uniref:hypothetical protein n=1 Tax=Paenibacillus sp. PAMC 26794 TaxID=1257080 RepID=UPI000318A580|nr:hypothetical protein [Paenibacillus sp. PAMC 26794]